MRSSAQDEPGRGEGTGPRQPRDSGPPLKTYSHLATERRVPTEYEIATTKLLYSTRRGLEVDVPLKRWYEQFQQATPLQCSDWDRFQDPRRTTYSSYVALQHKKEIYVDGILQSIDDRAYDKGLSPAWRGVFERVIAPARYLFHGLQMLSA